MKNYRNDEELIKYKEHKRSVLNGLHDRYKELKEAGVKCSIENEKAIIGEYKNEPFCVYYLTLCLKNGEMISVLMTRWKGKDHRQKKPLEVMNVS